MIFVIKTKNKNDRKLPSISEFNSYIHIYEQKLVRFKRKKGEKNIWKKNFFAKNRQNASHPNDIMMKNWIRIVPKTFHQYNTQKRKVLITFRPDGAFNFYISINVTPLSVYIIHRHDTYTGIFRYFISLPDHRGLSIYKCFVLLI